MAARLGHEDFTETGMKVAPPRIVYSSKTILGPARLVAPPLADR